MSSPGQKVENQAGVCASLLLNSSSSKRQVATGINFVKANLKRTQCWGIVHFTDGKLFQAWWLVIAIQNYGGDNRWLVGASWPVSLAYLAGERLSKRKLDGD